MAKKYYQGLSTISILIIIVLIAAVGGGIIFLYKSHTPPASNNLTQIAPVSSSTVSTSSNANPSNANNQQAANFYNGFMKMEKGAWSDEVIVFPSGKSVHQKAIFLGQEKVDGKLTNRVEVNGQTESGDHFVVQLWIQGKGLDIIKAASKGFRGDPKTYCVSKSLLEQFMPGFESEVPSINTPEQYKPGQPNIAYGAYTTPTGKTVKVAKIRGNAGETWVSSQVPFGIVKVIDLTNGKSKTTTYLYDFGLQGGQPEMSDQEVENCQSLPLPF